MKYIELLNYGSEIALKNSREDSAIKILMLYVTKVESHILLNKMNEEVSIEEEKLFKKLLNMYVVENIPIQYLTNEEYFYGYNFYVNEDVLIPRFETEELVSNVLLTYDEVFKGKEVKVVDVGTGSGAIAISLSLEEKKMKVYASEISENALKVAQKNNQKLEADVEFFLGDMLEPLKGKKFDILVSNPPYIPLSEKVDSLVIDNEPNLALFGGEDGLKFYQLILRGAKEVLNIPNFIAFEHAFNTASQIKQLALQYFEDAEIRTLKDLQGKDRMTIIINRDKNEKN